jgi:hypothetical protein
VARDASGGDIASQITVTADGTAAGIYKYSFVPALAGLYLVSIHETTSGGYFDSEFQVGGSLIDRIYNLANQGQSVSLGAGAAAFTYTNTLTVGGIPKPGVVINVYVAQDTNGSDGSAVVDLQTVIATTTTDGSGNFTINVNKAYYALHYLINGVFSQTYIRWSVSGSAWVTSSSPIAAS